MIDAQLHLKSICSLGVGTHHDACVVDQNIHMFLLWKNTEARFSHMNNVFTHSKAVLDQQTFVDDLSKRFNGLGVGEIEFPDDHVFISRVLQNVCPRLLGPLQVPARHHNAGS